MQLIMSDKLTVGELKKAIAHLPDRMPVFSDVVEAETEAFTAGIVSFEAGIPRHWRGVKGVESGLWVHLQIVEMEP